jgi:hypothetical protein
MGFYDIVALVVGAVIFFGLAAVIIGTSGRPHSAEREIGNGLF